jgi:hypothetical protein
VRERERERERERRIKIIIATKRRYLVTVTRHCHSDNHNYNHNYSHGHNTVSKYTGVMSRVDDWLEAKAESITVDNPVKTGGFIRYWNSTRYTWRRE